MTVLKWDNTNSSAINPVVVTSGGTNWVEPRVLAFTPDAVWITNIGPLSWRPLLGNEEDEVLTSWNGPFP